MSEVESETKGEEFTLKSGRKVVIRELTMLDDVMCQQIFGEGQTEETLNGNLLGNAYMQTMLECVMAIVEYNGKSIAVPGNMSEALDVMKRLPKRDGEEILKLHKEINDADLGK